MTIKELKEALDKLGIAYANDAKLADLQALYDESQIPFEIKPGQIVKVLTKDSEGNEIEGEMELDNLMGYDSVLIDLKTDLSDEQEAHKATQKLLEAERESHEATKKALEVAEKKLQELESGKTKDGLNIVYLQTPVGIKTRFRAGIKVTNERTRYEVSDEVLAELQQDNAILISQ